MSFLNIQIPEMNLKHRDSISMGKVAGICILANSLTERVQELLSFSLREDLGQSSDSRGTISMPSRASSPSPLPSRESGRARLQRARWGHACTESRDPYCHHTPWKSEFCILRWGWGGGRERKQRKGSWSHSTLGLRQGSVLRERGSSGGIGGGEQQWASSHRVREPQWESPRLGIDSTAAWDLQEPETHFRWDSVSFVSAS